MKTEIIKYKPDQSFDEFKKLFVDERNDTLFEEYKNFGMRLYKHILSKIDLTGTIDFITKENENFELNYFKEKILSGIYQLLKGFHELKIKHENLEEKLLKNEISILVYHYNQKVMNTINNDKIYYFKNIVCNGFLNSFLNIEEKILFLNLIDELTYDQINILAILYEFHIDPQPIRFKLNMIEDCKNLTVEMVSKLLNKNNDNTRILINNLIGRGLAIKLTRYIDMDTLENDSMISIEEFVKVFIKEIKEIY